MSELVDVNFGGVQVTVDADAVVIVNSASAVFLGIGYDLNKVVRHIGGKVPQTFVVVSHDIPFGIEGIE